MDQPDDIQLVAAAKGGDKDAFEALVLRYRAPAVRFAASMVGAANAEDIAQEAFATLYLRLEVYENRGSFKSWLFTILRNKAIDWLRRQKGTLPLEEAAGVALPDAPQEALANSEAWRELAHGWQRLPPEARSALYLFAVEEMRYDDIARTLGKTTGGTKMLIHRARKQLRKELARL